jgi:hypothetical protein
MDEREANIDLLFRKGLKDYEVLPPAGVWDKISPVIRKRQRPYVILRAAAMIAVLATLSFLTATWNSEFSDSLVSNPVQQDPISGTPQSETSDAVLLAAADNKDVIQQVSAINAPSPEIIVTDITENNPEISLGNPLPVHGLPEAETEMSRRDLAFTASSDRNTLNIDYSPVLYTPAEMISTGKKEKWSIAALVSPTYISTFNSAANEAASQINDVEQPVISYSGGIALAYKVSKRLSIQSGLYYASYGNELSGISSFGGFQNYDQVKGNSNFEVQTSNGTVYTNNADVYLIDNLSDNRVAAYFDRGSFDPGKASLEYLNNSLMQNLGYLELPVILRYKVIDRAFDFNIIGGVSSNLLVNNSVYTSVDGDRYQVGRTEGLNSVLFTSSLGMGMEYSITNNLSLNLEPTFRYYLNSFNNLSGMSNLHPYTFGIFSGLSYKF